jgi:hypothetical protein
MSEVLLSIKGVSLKLVSVFKYLGLLLLLTDEDWPAVYHNLSKACQHWARVSQVLAQHKGAEAHVSAMLYKAIVQSVLLYGSETWVLTPAMLKVLEGFHLRLRWHAD